MPMTYSEFKDALARTGLTVREFAELIGMSPTAVSNYSKYNRVSKHLAVIVTLMAEMAEGGSDFRGALAKIDLAPGAPRGSAHELEGSRRGRKKKGT